MQRLSRYLINRRITLKVSPKPNRFTTHSWKLQLIDVSSTDKIVGSARYCVKYEIDELPQLYVSQIKTEELYRRSGYVNLMQFIMAEHARAYGAIDKETSTCTDIGKICFDKLPTILDDRCEMLAEALFAHLPKN